MSAQPAQEPRRHLKLVDGDTGEVVDSQELAKLQAELEKLRIDLKMAQRDVKAKNRRIAELERDRARERLDHPHRDLIERVATYWHRKCRPKDYAKARPRINPVSPERFDAVAALVEREEIEMVEGKRRRKWRFEMEDFKAAIDGAEFDPYVTTLKNGKRVPQNDLEQICRDERRFEMARAKCPYEPVPILPARVRPGVVVLDRPVPDRRCVGLGWVPGSVPPVA